MSRIRMSGGYRLLASFQTATLIYDSTVWFCERFVETRSRTVDQMVQAARSGRQNIAEGSRASAVSSQTELRLTNVARASLEELLLDYEDFLRHRRMKIWNRDDRQSLLVRSVPKRWKEQNSSPNREITELTDQERWDLYSEWLDNDESEVRANATICLIHQANFLLDRQITQLEESYIKGGGYSEQLAIARLDERQRRSEAPNPGQGSKAKIPECPKCEAPMVLRTARGGQNPGSQFWGCSSYPECKGTVQV
ncbi:four helix bundle suffix domain-containing protein [Stieleria sp. JC731]|uniref:four helix bundle suffix domain-containing protein n=1 Tax=Pirellulaceae TaxID=2691357 RepID=UPI001E3CCB46|nr:four helix bundle suffix domain-containing protein [Stieleria sp. JC731]MCC9601135.1 four helix bundle suffix domain-containing protein [Stieleria sp. JC731]